MRAMLANINFRRLWLAQIILALGDALMQMGLLELFRTHHLDERAETAKLFFAVSLPGLIFGPVAIAYLDRWQRRRVLIISDALRAGIVLVVAAWILPLVTGRVEHRGLLLVYTMIGFVGVIGTFYLPARSALLPNLVERADLVKANTLFASSLAIATVGGRALGGFVAEHVGVTWAVLANMVAYLCSGALLWRIAMTPHATTAVNPDGRQGGLGEFCAGMVYLREHPTALPLVILSALFAFLLGILMVTFVGYAMATLGLRTGGVGYLVAAGGAGAAIGVGVFSRGKPWTQADWLPFLQLIVAAAALIVLSLTTNVWVAVPLVIVLGGVAATVVIHIDAKLQAQVEDVRRGAVFAARGMLTSATMIVAFGLQFGSAAFRQTPPPTVLWRLGVGTLAVALLTLLAVRLRAKPAATK